MKGRKNSSEIRENIASLLLHLKKSYGYEVYKNYIEVFGKVHIRSIYYNLKKGVATKEFEIDGVRRERGDYTWGPESERMYYTLGPAGNAKQLAEEKLKKIRKL